MENYKFIQYSSLGGVVVTIFKAGNIRCLHVWSRVLSPTDGSRPVTKLRIGIVRLEVHTLARRTNLPAASIWP